MVERVGTTFPKHSEYGKYEVHIFNSLVKQVENKFKDKSNLVINTTWFGSQFNNIQWQNALNFTNNFDNLLYMLSL